MGKGQQAERDISRELSLWWSNGVADDWFWRSSQSGGRATQRAKSGKSTINAAGDIAAQCVEAQKLLDVITIEIKRGYNKISIADIWEKESGGFHEFIAQAEKAASLAGTTHYMVIHKRDRRNMVVVIGECGKSARQAYIGTLASLLTDENRERFQEFINARQETDRLCFVQGSRAAAIAAIASL